MASFSRSFKPGSFMATARRPGIPRRQNSSSSISSVSSARSEEQFVLSQGNTPITENPPSHSSSSGPAISITAATDDYYSRNVLPVRTDNHSQSSSSGIIPTSSSTDNANRHNSKPIAIELPSSVPKVSSSGNAYTPPEPVSARGDLPGGYFPLHEDPHRRVHRPHPFHGDAKLARHQSLSLAAERTSPAADHAANFPAAMSDPASQYPLLNAINNSRSRTHTPVTSYVPIGVNADSPLPVGKYYPSNYEFKNNSQNPVPTKSQHLRPPTSAPTAASIKSDTQVPKYRSDSSHARSDSEAKRRLQQYQRDMVAQATLAASQVLGKRGNSKMVTSSVHGMSVGNINLNKSMGQKPTSPRLLPLGSPGPVTPMDLEGGDSYLTLGRAVSGPDAEREAEEIARAIRIEAERRRREGATSPAIELGPVTF